MKGLIIFMACMVVINIIGLFLVIHRQKPSKYFVGYKFEEAGQTFETWSVVTSGKRLDSYEIILETENNLKKSKKAESLKIVNFIEL